MMNQISKSITVVSLMVNINKEIPLSKEEVGDQYIAGNIFQREIGNMDRENFAVLCLDTKGFPTCLSIAHIGTLNQTLLHIREIFKIAIVSNSNSIIVGHNHPSGDVNPSKEDIEKTKNIVEAGKVLGISVLDHIVVSSREASSMRNIYPNIF